MDNPVYTYVWHSSQGGQTATPSSLTVSRSRAITRSCALPAAVVVGVIVVVPSPAHVNLYALL
jgi:hypothetical protein